MTIREALDNINNFREVSEFTLNESFNVVMFAKSDSKMDVVKHLIEKYDLKRNNRSLDYAYKRMYLSWFLREHDCTYSTIGNMLHRKHESIMHLVNRHHEMENFNYKIYYEKTKDLRDVLAPADVGKSEKLVCPDAPCCPNLKHGILECACCNWSEI